MLLTLKDVVDDLIAIIGGVSSIDVSRQCRSVVQRSLMEIVNAKPNGWRHSIKTGKIQLSAPYDTGTVVYDHTGGSSERLVTLTSGTFPGWAQYGTIDIGGTRYLIDQRLSSTTLTLFEDDNPGDDVSSTAYSIVRQMYLMPRNVARSSGFASVVGQTYLRYISPDAWHSEQTQWISRTGQPEYFTILRDRHYSGRYVLAISPAPSSAITLDYLARTRPEEPVVESYTTGTVAVTADGTTVTGTGTAFLDSHVGCVIRLGTTSQIPTSWAGSRPPVAEAVILSVDSPTSLTVDTPFPESLSGVKLEISSLIDIDREVMQNVFYSLCRLKLAQERTMMEQLSVYGSTYRRDLELAFSADNRTMFMPGTWGTWDRISLALSTGQLWLLGRDV